MAFQRHVWSAFDFSEIGPELTYNDLRIVWLKMHSVLLKPTIRWILRKGLLIAQIGFPGWVRTVRLKRNHAPSRDNLRTVRLKTTISCAPPFK